MTIERVPHHYALLGVPTDASAEAIKRAWKRAAGRWHPDVVRHDDRTRFDAVREAWEVLSDGARRAAYDAALQAEVDRAVAGQSRLQGTQRIGGVVSRVLGVRATEPAPGRNRRMRLAVGFAEAVRGTDIDVEIDAQVRCEACDATGASPAGRTWVCGACGGVGEVLEHGLLRSSWTRCGACAGLGWIPEPRCETCSGRGSVVGVARVSVPVPAGTRTGQVLRLARQGEPSASGGDPGDLLVEVDVRAHAFLTPVGIDLRCERPVPFWVALAGGRVEVPTLEGSARIAIPAGTRSGDVLRMAGFGLEGGGGVRGDQLVTITVEWPRELGPEALEALRAWGQALPPEAFVATHAFDARVASGAAR